MVNFEHVNADWESEKTKEKIYLTKKFLKRVEINSRKFMLKSGHFRCSFSQFKFLASINQNSPLPLYARLKLNVHKTFYE